MVIFTVIMHLVGLMGLLRLSGYHIRNLLTRWLWLDRLLVPLTMVFGLFALHGLEVWAYTLLLCWLGTAPTLEQALFLSISAYSSVGFASLDLHSPWRIVAGIEALNGMLLIGWSTAFLFQNLERIMTSDRAH